MHRERGSSVAAIRSVGPRLFGIVFGVLFLGASALAQEPADPDDCGFESQHYVPAGGDQVHSERYSSRDGNFSFQESLGANVRARLKFDLVAATSAEWRLRLVSNDNACTNAREFIVDRALVGRHGDNLLSPVMCGRLRLEWEIEDGGDAPPVELTVYELKVPYQQLGIYDSKNRLKGPNWCKVSDFETGRDGAPPAKFYAPNSDDFVDAVSSAVFIGWELTKPTSRWSAATQQNEIRPEYSLNSCTGFFIAPNLVMTNRHCVCPVKESKGRACPGERGESAFDGGETFKSLSDLGQLEARDWRIWTRSAGLEGGRNDAPVFQRATPVILGALKSETERAPPVETPPWPLDYAILRVSQSEVDGSAVVIQPAKLLLNAPETQSSLLIAHYPGNYPFAASYDSDCKLVRAETLPEMPYDSVQIGHGCDTHGGSSGSAVWLRDLSGVVGVHYCCSNPTDKAAFDLLANKPEAPIDDLTRDHPALAAPATTPNKFVPVRRIICDIRRRNVRLFDEIARAQAWTAADRQHIKSFCGSL